MVHLSTNTTFILVFFGLLVLLAGVILYYIEYAINSAISVILHIITLGHNNDAAPVFPGYQLPSTLIGIGLICVTIPFLIYLGGILVQIFKEKTFSIKDSVILAMASFIVTRFIDFATTSLSGIDRTVPYATLGAGFIGIVTPAAILLALIINNKIRSKKTISVKDFPWVISSGVTLILCDYILGKVHYDDTGLIPRILADFGYAYVLIPLSIYLHGIIHKIRSKKAVNVKNTLILFAVGIASITFVGLNINIVPNHAFSIDFAPHIGDKLLFGALYFVGISCIIISLSRGIIIIRKVFKNKDLVKVKGYSGLIIEYVRNHNVVDAIKKIGK